MLFYKSHKGVPRVGFCTYQDAWTWERGEVASTRIRVYYVAKYMKNAIISNSPEELKTCDVVIFQTRYARPDLELAKELKNLGKIVIVDLTDPHWSKYYNLGKEVDENLIEMIELADLATLPTESLMFSFEDDYPKRVAVVIPDRMDMKIHSGIKKHEAKNKYTMLWHGSYGNICGVELAREALEKLGTEFKIKLLCIYDHCKEHNIEPFKNLELECREWSNEIVINGIMESDVGINPRFTDWRRYKSNNKTVKSWSLGVPCVEFNFYEEIKKLLSSAELRNEEGRRLKTVVKDKYDSRQSAVDLQSIAEILISQKEHRVLKPKAKPRSNIVVYTAITGGYDSLKENQCTEGADFVAFADTPAQSEVWKIILFKSIFKSPTRSAKIFKILSHQYTPDYEYSMWMDGNFVLRVPVKTLIDEYLKDNNMAVFRHNKRDCIYQEGKYDVLVRRDREEIVEEQLAKYMRDGHPPNSGLYACGVLIRRNCKAVEEFNNAWWSEICSGSERDQTSFAYLVRKLKMKLGYLNSGEYEYYNSEEFQYLPHVKGYERTYESGIQRNN